MIGTAWAADAAEGHGGGIFSDPAFWVGVAFVLFFALAGKALWKRVSDILDKRASAIAKALADAERLRDEAQRMQARAEASLKNAVALREQQAIDRIAQSEGAAAKQVRDTAVDVALSATRALLREQVGTGRSEAMINEAIGEVPRRLH